MKKDLYIYILGLVFALQIYFSSGLNLRPIIGILSEPSDSSHGNAYIAASYIKYIESAGGRAVPIFFNLSNSEVTNLLNKINGVLFPGGGVDLENSPIYRATLENIWKYVIKANDAGDYFPLWGTCLGFQETGILAAKDDSVLKTGFDSENYPIPLNFTNLAKTSRLFGNAGSTILNILSNPNTPVTMNNHVDGIEPSSYDNNPNLKAFFNVLSTNVDRKGREFISTWEAKKYPIYAAQWHPEKNPFEWTVEEDVPHSYEAVLVAQYTSNFFVSECRKNGHKFSNSGDEKKALIYNYSPVYTNDHDFVQTYYFKVNA